MHGRRLTASLGAPFNGCRGPSTHPARAVALTQRVAMRSRCRAWHTLCRSLRPVTVESHEKGAFGVRFVLDRNGTLPAGLGWMSRRMQAWVIASAGFIAFSIGCGGTVQATDPVGSAGASGGERSDLPGGRGNSAGAPGQAGQGAAPGIQAGSSGTGGHEGPCTGDLNTVASSWWTTCPPTLSAARAWAESCSALQPRAETRVTTCGLRVTITLDYATHGKECYYEVLPPCDGEGELVGAEAWDDVPSYCNGTSTQIQAGRTSLRCARDAKQSRVVCVGTNPVEPVDGAGGAAGAGGEDPVPESGPALTACYNAFGSTCEPCCPTTTPECADKPDGYPGYACTPAPKSFCSCTCNGGQWRCGC